MSGLGLAQQGEELRVALAELGVVQIRHLRYAEALKLLGQRLGAHFYHACNQSFVGPEYPYEQRCQHCCNYYKYCHATFHRLTSVDRRKCRRTPAERASAKFSLLYHGASARRLLAA